MRQSIKEIKKGVADKLASDTNIPITISSHDKLICSLAHDLNIQLKNLQEQRHQYRQGDIELKNSITNISHDLRTPLTAICGYLNLLGKEEKSETVTRYLNIVENRTMALRKLTEELFNYTIAISDSEEIALKNVNINQILEESITSYYAVLKQQNITPEISIPDQKIICFVDENLVARIFSNIISNSIKYSDGDLKILLTEKGEIIFSNHASGLTEIQTGRLFDRFYTVNSARKSTGLGLSIAKILTEKMGGTITANYQNNVISIHVWFES
ncbi:hypothetical protein EDD59_1401 [Muricomes intestini]|jgi:hypothetical protein|uniref:histidine kinase n=2 Tax=Muricomes intestini TaxID=1796634 RepID=A0A4R3JZJ5_9FIRM|nr:HAMP domain-containing sensor histidine kinase [Muricomes intestini]TCS74358.1 hypothetical protein EDD59_1401 [Muricomes intestini]